MEGMESKLKNDTEIAHFKRDYDFKKAGYDVEGKNKFIELYLKRIHLTNKLSYNMFFSHNTNIIFLF